MANLIVQENQLTGNPDTEWDLAGAGSTNIEGFATDISFNRGQTVSFKINTNSANYRIDIYRLGYYGGRGARKLATLLQTTASVQPPPIVNSSLGWLMRATGMSRPSGQSQPPLFQGFISPIWCVRTRRAAKTIFPSSSATTAALHDIVFQTSDTTWHAYNGWGGYSLYGGGASGSSDGRAYKVSYNRPIATRDGVGTYAGPQDFLFGVEIAAIHWLEANGYDVCYMAGVDTDRRGAELLNHKVFLSVGHDEYWSGAQRANVEAARAAGVHLAFWSGNEVFWKTRYESSTVTTDGSPTTYRTLVCYKETRDDKSPGPARSSDLHLQLARPAFQSAGRRRTP